MSRTTINEVLEAARAGLDRLAPAEALAAQRDGELLVDTRSTDARVRQGVIPESLHVPLSVLEWRVDPDADPRFRSPHVHGLDDHLLLICAHGYSSSLAACRSQDLGFTRATDLAGGFEAWRAADLPLVAAPPDPAVPGLGDPAPS